MIIGVDCDNTVVGMQYHWYCYLSQRYPYKHIPGKLPYDLTEAFDIPADVDGKAFWKDVNLYEGLQPIKDSVAVLKKFKEQGHEIVFVSAHKGFHTKSKYYWIDKFFPFKDGVLLTKEKKYARIDVLIDDNLEVLSKLSDHVIKIHIDNGLQNTVEFTPDFACYNWKEIGECLEKITMSIMFDGGLLRNVKR